MKRLFTVNGEHFASKQAAKVARGEPIEKAKPAEPGVIGSKNQPPKYKHEIEYGPDHWKRGGAVPGFEPKPAVKVPRVRKAKPKAEPVLLDGDGVIA